MSELPPGVRPAVEPVPRDSAAGVVLRADGAGSWRVLLGLRSRKARFMPGHLAFPGGMMEEDDRPREAGARARCASRELLEETGLEIPVDAWHEAGERVTPPLFPVRFRTGFFTTVLKREGAGEQLAPLSAENEALEFRCPRTVLDEWFDGRVKLPPPVLPILRALAAAKGSPIEEVAADLRRANALEERATRIEFAPGIWTHPMRTETLPPATHTNAWLPGGRRFVVVDPGSADPAEVDRLLAVVARRSESGDSVVAVLLTHHHRDHIGGALAVARALRCPVHAHPQVLESLGRSASDVTLRAMDDGDEIGLEGLTLRAVFTPGHAPGHLAFLLVEPRLLVAGDLISGTSTILIDPEQGDMEAYFASLERARALECRILLPGHGPPLPGGHLRRLIEHRTWRESRIRDRLAKGPATLTEIAGSAYAGESAIPPALVEAQTLAHLIRLERRGAARRADTEGAGWSPAGNSGD